MIEATELRTGGDDMQGAVERLRRRRTESPSAPESEALARDPQPEPTRESPQASEVDAGSPDGASGEPAQSSVSLRLQDVAERLGVEVAALYDVEVPISGEQAPVKLGALKDGHQNTRHAMRDREDLAIERERFERQSVATQQAQAQLLAQAQHGAVLLRALADEYAARDAIDWDGLRASDPHEWAARQEERRSRAERFQRFRDELGGLVTAGRSVSAQLTQQDFERLQGDAARETLSRIPQWRDGALAKREVAEIREYLATQGCTPAEIDGIAPRAVAIVRKAMLYDRGVDAAKLAKKGLTMNGKTLQPGARARGSSTGARTAKLRAELRRTGDHRTALKLLGAMRKTARREA